MKLTKKEKELILKKRAEEEALKPKKVGYLKEDLYSYENDEGCNLKFYADCESGFWLCNKEQKNKWIEEFSKHFEIALKKGSKFVCYIDDDEDRWYDDHNYGVESMDAEWAQKFLENIENI